MSLIHTLHQVWAQRHFRRMRRKASSYNTVVGRAMDNIPVALQQIWKREAAVEFPGMPTNEKTWAWAVRGLLDYFAVASATREPTLLPSKAADSVWHVWLRHDPIGLETFQRHHFGRAVQHVEKENMPRGRDADVALPRTWAMAMHQESHGSASVDVPFLFRVDGGCGIPNGWDYRRNGRYTVEMGVIRSWGRTRYQDLPMLTVSSLVALGLVTAAQAADWTAWVTPERSGTSGSSCGSGMADSGDSSCGGGSCGGGCGGD